MWRTGRFLEIRPQIADAKKELNGFVCCRSNSLLGHLAMPVWHRNISGEVLYTLRTTTGHFSEKFLEKFGLIRSSRIGSGGYPAVNRREKSRKSELFSVFEFVGLS